MGINEVGLRCREAPKTSAFDTNYLIIFDKLERFVPKAEHGRAWSVDGGANKAKMQAIVGSPRRAAR